MRKGHKIIAAVLLSALLLAGCSSKTETGAADSGTAGREITDLGISDVGIADTGATDLGTADPEIADLAVTDLAVTDHGIANPGRSETVVSYGQTVSVQDLKDEYLYDDSRDIMPLYNVEQTEVFDFVFSFDANDAGIDLYDLVSVHTDAACHRDSAIYYTASLKVADGKTALTVSPMDPVLATDRQSADYAYEEVDRWGNAPIYYMALHYDLEADHAAPLSQPVIIPFTVRREATTPTVRGTVSDDGRFFLAWEPVAGAEKYIVYNLVDGNLQTGVDNHPIDGAGSGYDCGINTSPEEQLYLQRTGETAECAFDGFSGPESHSLSEIANLLTGKISNSGQNYNVCGEYFVTAVVDGQESGLSNPVSTAELILPFTVVREEELQHRYPTPGDFPAEVTVQNIDGSTSVRAVRYERVHVDMYDLSWDEYDYTVEGTCLHGSVGFDRDEGEPPQPADTAARTGKTAPNDLVEMIPSADLRTILPTDGSAQDALESLVHIQADNTRDHMKTGNLLTVDNVPEGIYLNADTAQEKWLALNMVHGNADISVEGFTALQDPYTLKDVFYKVYYQNPYIMGIRSFSYDYEDLCLHVEYLYDRDTLADKQAAIAAKARKVVGSLITEDMDTQEKIQALYLYLENHAVYDSDALAQAQENGFIKTVDFSHEDAFNAYGVLVDEKGVCMSYAYVFRMLCDLSGVDCIVATGYLDGSLPHAWNMVKIDGQWYEIDCTNNAVNTGIPYFLFQADSHLALCSGYTKDSLFALDEDVSGYIGSDSSREYYRQNGLCPQDMEEYKEIITRHVDGETETFAVRWQGRVEQDSFEKAVTRAYSELGIGNMLDSLRYSVTGEFIVLKNGR